MLKVILVFCFGPRLGLKTEDLGQAEQYIVKTGFGVKTVIAVSLNFEH